LPKPLVDPPRAAARLEPAPVSSEAAAELLRGLNREQRRAVTHGDGPALVIAGPGTGKTEVITRRVAWLIATKRALPREILALTFTDNAAQEMQARVDFLVPYGQADAAIHTFHAFGDRVVREHAFELGMGANLRLLTRAELIVFLRERVFELGLHRYRPLGDPTRFLGALVDFFGRAKDEDIAVATLAGDAERLRVAAIGASGDDEAARLGDLAAARVELAGAFERYCQLMAANGFIDHADQVGLALRLLRLRPGVRAELARRYRYVLVDELQDTNRSQVELVLALVGASGNVMAVGDPDQGIYGFRGARAGHVDRFQRSLTGLTTIPLRRNYRSLTPIVAAAQRVTSVARDGVSATSRQVAHRRGRGKPVRHCRFRTPEAEADGVATEIESRIRAGARPRDFCVLVRSNSETDEHVRSLRVRGIDVDNGAVGRLFDVPAVRALVAFMRVVANPADSLETFTLASSDPYRLRGEVLTRLLNGARRRNRSLLDALGEAAQSGDPQLSDAVRRTVALAVEHIRNGVALASEHTSGEVLYDYLRRSGMLARLARADDTGAAAQARSVARFCELVRARAALLASDRVAFLVPALELGEPDDDADLDYSERDAVRVLTVHRAKGLEFDTVFISGLVDGRFPVRSRPAVLSLPHELIGEDVESERALDEERRLFYVALTRARNEVVLTSHELGPRGRGRRRPSIFIAEALDTQDVAPSDISPVIAGVSGEALAYMLVPPPAPAVPDAAGRPLTLSYSQIDEYLTCPERYRLRYDIGIPTPAHHALSYGTAIHQAIAAFHAAQARGAVLSEDELIEELRGAVAAGRVPVA